jgi:hypothetical protein
MFARRSFVLEQPSVLDVSNRSSSPIGRPTFRAVASAMKHCTKRARCNNKEQLLVYDSYAMLSSISVMVSPHGLVGSVLDSHVAR